MRRLRILTAVTAALLATGCTAFRSSAREDGPTGDVALGFDWLQKHRVVELEGRFDGDVFEASRVEIEEPDDEIELKTHLGPVDVAAGTVEVAGLVLHASDRSEFRDREGRSISLEDIERAGGSWAKAEALLRDGRLELRRVTLRERLEAELEELQGRIEAIEGRRRRLDIGGVMDARVARDAEVVWDVQGEDPPSATEAGLGLTGGRGRRSIQRLDDDDRRPSDQFTIGEIITVGGEIQWDLEWRKNHDLRNVRNRDRLLHQASAKLELSFDLGEQAFAFTQIGLGREFVIDDFERNFNFGTDLELNEGFFLFTDIPFDGAALQIGRQDFDQGREWLMDENLDGLRLWLNFDPVLFEFSVSERLFATSREDEDVTNWLAAAHVRAFEDTELFVYGMLRQGGVAVELDRWHLGFSLETTPLDELTVWLDVGYVVGREGDLEVEGFGFDVMAMWVFDRLPLEPSLYAGYAWGSGDDDLSDGRDEGFRQSGIQDNNDKFNGVTSFRYLGELVRPELSNLSVITFGAGLRIAKRTSLDFVYHHYRQVEASTILRDTRLRLNPQGLREDLGNEWDLVIGIEDFRPVEIEIVLGYFNPGPAFGPSPDDAWFATMVVEFNF